MKLGYNGRFNFTGQLINQGTSGNPVVFTSILDDEFGGDTNNDGTSTLPAKGDWRQLRFESAAAFTLQGAIIRYGGGACDGGNCWGAINLVLGTLEIKDSVIEKNMWGIFNGAGNCPGAFESIKLTNVVFSGNDRNIALPYGVDCTPP